MPPMKEKFCKDVPLATRGIAHYTREEILLRRHSTRIYQHNSIRQTSHPDISAANPIRNSSPPTFHLDISHPDPATFHLLWISHIRVRSTFHYLRVLCNQCLLLDGRGRRFNFTRRTCLNPSVTLSRRTSVASDSDSPDNLAHQIFAIRRIHFRPQ